jgi:signal peptidase I
MPDIVVTEVQNRQEGWRGALSTILILVAAPVVALLLINFVFQSYQVSGPSMQTTLQDNDRLIVNKIPRTIAKITGKAYIPDRGDIIIFAKHGVQEFGSQSDKQLIKRVIGLPGERIIVKDGKITIINSEFPNGFDPDTSEEWKDNLSATTGNVDVTLGEDEIFVCGDNRSNSLDSRTIGPISAADIIGKLTFRLFPIGEAKSF